MMLNLCLLGFYSYTCIISSIAALTEVDVKASGRDIEVHDYQEEICKSDCDAFCNKSECPLNVGSIIGSKFSGDKIKDYNVIIGSSIGKPSVVLAHVSKSDLMHISPSGISETANFWVNSIQNVASVEGAAKSKSSFSRTLDLLSFGPHAELGKSINIIGIQFESIFEFTDVNNNGIFDTGIDEPLRVYDLERSWAPMLTNTTTTTIPGDNDMKVGTMILKSKDEVITIVIETTSFSETSDNFSIPTQLRTPHSARVSVKIENFKHIEQSSSIGIKAVIICPFGSSKQNGYTQMKNSIHVSDKISGGSVGYIQWSDSALSKSLTESTEDDVGFSPQDVKSSSMMEADPSEVSYSLGKSTLWKESGSSSGGGSSGSGGLYHRGEAQILYFSFSGDSSIPTDIVWDLSIGLGSLPRSMTSVETYGGIGLIVLSILSSITCCAVSSGSQTKRFYPFEKKKLT